MKNITKVGLSALAGALAFTSVNAGEMSLSGSMEASYTKKVATILLHSHLVLDKELSITGSGELDNGVSVAYKQTTSDALAFNDSELVFTGVPMLGDGSIALTSTGSPISAIDDVTPTAFEEANATVGSIDDVNGSDGTYGLRYTLADALVLELKLMLCTSTNTVQEMLMPTTVQQALTVVNKMVTKLLFKVQFLW